MRAAIVLAVLALAACRSSAGQFYTLVPLAPDKHAEPGSEFQIELLPIDVPADVDRTQLVVRRSSGEVAMVDSQSWIAPLSLELRRAFAGTLQAKLGARVMTDELLETKRPTFKVKLVVQRFESVLGDRALIEATWSVRGEKGEPLVCSMRTSEWASGGYDKLVEAHQRALSRVAEQVASGVRAVYAGSPVCPVNAAVRR